jgi:hypothetical protein
MVDGDLRFCPRCGTGLVEGMSYCPKCGFNVDELTAPVRRLPDDERRGAPEPRRSNPSLILAAVIVAAGLIGYGLLTRPSPAGEASTPAVDASGVPISFAPGVTAPPSAPIVGMTIQSPRDGEQVFTKEVTVIGLAPPGTRITRDVSLRPDQHATADSTGHWAIAVSLDQGGNTLVFRIGDDRSTEQRIRVTFTTPAG